MGQIPDHSLVLVAYTVSLYRAAQGSRKDQPTVPLSISFAVVLYDQPLDVQGGDGGEDAQEQEGDSHDGEASDNQSDETLQDQSGEDAEEAEELSDAVVEEQSDDD